MDNHLLSHAIAIATEAHKGQKDKYGQEYLHLFCLSLLYLILPLPV